MSKILIVEDDLVFARALKNWLEKEHFQVEYPPMLHGHVV